MAASTVAHATYGAGKDLGRRRGSLVVSMAKKKGKGSKGPGGKSGKNAKQKTVGQSAEKVRYLSSDVIMTTLQLVESYKRETGRTLMDGEMEITDAPRALYEAPFVCLAHDGGEDPVFTYANEAALKLWEVEWDDLVGMPSRKSAEESGDVQEDRTSALKEALEKGCIENYSGVRVSSRGKRFEIKDATLWTIRPGEGESVGQAAVFSDWQFVDCADEEDLFTPEKLRQWRGKKEETTAEVPPPANIEDLRKQVDEQGDKIRAMKESGLSNQDEEVQQEVSVLLKLKQELEDAEKKTSNVS